MLTPGPTKAMAKAKAKAKGKEAKRVKEKGAKIAVKVQAANPTIPNRPKGRQLVPKENMVAPTARAPKGPSLVVPKVVLVEPGNGPTIVNGQGKAKETEAVTRN